MIKKYLSLQLLYISYKTRKYIDLKYLKIVLILVMIHNISYSQVNTSYSLGDSNEFSENIMVRSKSSSKTLPLQVSDDMVINGIINVQKGDTENFLVIGSIDKVDESTFIIKKNAAGITGTIILHNERKAYQYYSGDNNDVIIEEVDINGVLCMDMKRSEAKEKGLIMF